MTEVPESLELLWQLADDLGHRSSVDPAYVLEHVGLILVRPLELWDSEYTPSNSLTFAQSGEDGTHFSLLQVEGLSLASAPVVMTVPNAGADGNVVIAADFDEFLAVGATGGWFTLERLAEGLDHALEELATADPDPWSEREQLLAFMRERLGIDPAPLTLKRFEQLQNAYGSAILTDADTIG
jgi:hypothetical protein